jgi:hypothetical protein
MIEIAAMAARDSPLVQPLSSFIFEGQGGGAGIGYL